MGKTAFPYISGVRALLPSMYQNNVPVMLYCSYLYVLVTHICHDFTSMVHYQITLCIALIVFSQYFHILCVRSRVLHTSCVKIKCTFIVTLFQPLHHSWYKLWNLSISLINRPERKKCCIHSDVKIMSRYCCIVVSIMLLLFVCDQELACLF